MAMSNPYNQYKQNEIMMASQEELTMLLYNGAIKFANLAILAIDEKNISKAHDAIIRTSDIISELNNTLDMQFEVSKNLRDLYTYLLERLLQANMKKDKTIIEEILPLLSELRDTWKEAIKLAKGK